MKSFNEWRNGKISHIYLDLDNTLIHIDSEGSVSLRPHAHEFIYRAKKIAPVTILTNGLTARQKKVSKKVSINISVIGRDNYDSVKQSPDAILIDNKPASDAHTRKKLNAVGIGDNKLIHIKAWDGRDDDDELMKILKMITDR